MVLPQSISCINCVVSLTTDAVSGKKLFFLWKIPYLVKEWPPSTLLSVISSYQETLRLTVNFIFWIRNIRNIIYSCCSSCVLLNLSSAVFMNFTFILHENSRNDQLPVTLDTKDFFLARRWGLGSVFARVIIKTVRDFKRNRKPRRKSLWHPG